MHVFPREFVGAVPAATPQALAKPWDALRYVLEPLHRGRPADADPTPAFYLGANTADELDIGLGQHFQERIERGLGPVRHYVDVCTPKTPLIERPGLLSLMADALSGLTSLVAAYGLFHHRFDFWLAHPEFGSAGFEKFDGSSLDWNRRWAARNPPSPSATYFALFAGNQLMSAPRRPESRSTPYVSSKTGEFALGRAYAIVISKAFWLAAHGCEPLEILTRLTADFGSWKDIAPQVSGLFERLACLASFDIDDASKLQKTTSSENV